MSTVPLACRVKISCRGQRYLVFLHPLGWFWKKLLSTPGSSPLHHFHCKGKFSAQAQELPFRSISGRNEQRKDPEYGDCARLRDLTSSLTAEDLMHPGILVRSWMDQRERSLLQTKITGEDWIRLSEASQKKGKGLLCKWIPIKLERAVSPEW